MSGLKARVLWLVGLHSNPDSTFPSFVMLGIVFNLSGLQIALVICGVNTKDYYTSIK